MIKRIVKAYGYLSGILPKTFHPFKQIALPTTVHPSFPHVFAPATARRRVALDAKQQLHWDQLTIHRGRPKLQLGGGYGGLEP